MALVRVLESPTVRAGTYGNLFFVEWVGQGAPVSELRQVNEARAAFRERIERAHVACLTVVGPKAATRVTPELKGELERDAQVCAKWDRSECLVLVAEGFGSAMIRSLIAGFMMLKRYDHPHKISSSLDDACAWMAAYVSPKLTGDKLKAIVTSSA